MNGFADPTSFLSHSLLLPDEDIARPTANGGFTHTSASRAKISAANRGKVPWNKGKERSPETRAKIAAGVQARNRLRFLAKLETMGLTEEQYELQQKQEKERKRQAAMARRTAKGGYIPTNETRQKISRILKEKYANQEIKPRNNTQSRRGFSHSEETRRKISESLRKRWSSDEKYRENMTAKQQGATSASETRKRISQTLKAKWQDPEFRAAMMAKMSNRTRSTGMSLDEEHRRKISEAMKAKWQDHMYRTKTLESIASRKEALAASRPPRPPRARAQNKRPSTYKKQKVVLRQLEPLIRPRNVESETKATSRRLPMGLESSDDMTTKPTVKRAPAPKSATRTKAIASSDAEDAPAPKPRGRKKADGDVSQLKEDRRDLFDLLYGDEESFTVNERTTLTFEDENLDDFDPYGLENE